MGRLTGIAKNTLEYEFWPQVPPEELGPYYKMEMEEIAAQGITTVSTRLYPNHLAAYAWLHVRGELPVRMAYTSEAVSRNRLWILRKQTEGSWKIARYIWNSD